MDQNRIKNFSLSETWKNILQAPYSDYRIQHLCRDGHFLRFLHFPKLPPPFKGKIQKISFRTTFHQASEFKINQTCGQNCPRYQLNLTRNEFRKNSRGSKKGTYIFNNFSSNFAPMVCHLYLKFLGKTCEPNKIAL